MQSFMIIWDIGENVGEKCHLKFWCMWQVQPLLCVMQHDTVGACAANSSVHLISLLVKGLPIIAAFSQHY